MLLYLGGQLLKLLKNIFVVDVTPAFGLMYSKIVQVPIYAGIFENPVPQVVTNRVEELEEENVELEVEQGDIDQRLQQEENVNQPIEGLGEGGSQLENRKEASPTVGPRSGSRPSIETELFRNWKK